jgi:hypothetical protein
MIDRVRLQGLKLTELCTGDRPSAGVRYLGLSRKPALLTGMNYLRQFSRVSIDYGLKEIRFDLAGLLVAEPA